MTTEQKTAHRPVLQAIADIMAEVGSVEKKGRNEFHRYDYATAADVAHALQKRMAEKGLIIIPHQRKMEMLFDGAALAIEFEFMVEHVSGDRLEDRPVFTGMAAAKNTKGGFDDKAANKCLTAASKYFALNLFRIPTGDYHDADADEDRGGNGNGKVAKFGGRQSSASLKRDGAWESFTANLADCRNTFQLSKLKADYEANEFRTWKQDWIEQANEAFEKRAAELEAPLSDADADAVAKALVAGMSRAANADALEAWEAERQTRDAINSLPQARRDKFRIAYNKRLSQLRFDETPITAAG